jgi:hypothetical protein
LTERETLNSSRLRAEFGKEYDNYQLMSKNEIGILKRIQIYNRDSSSIRMGRVGGFLKLELE